MATPLPPVLPIRVHSSLQRRRNCLLPSPPPASPYLLIFKHFLPVAPLFTLSKHCFQIKRKSYLSIKMRVLLHPNPHLSYETLVHTPPTSTPIFHLVLMTPLKWTQLSLPSAAVSVLWTRVLWFFTLLFFPSILCPLLTSLVDPRSNTRWASSLSTSTTSTWFCVIEGRISTEHSLGPQNFTHNNPVDTARFFQQVCSRLRYLWSFCTHFSKYYCHSMPNTLSSSLSSLQNCAEMAFKNQSQMLTSVPALP